MLCEVLNLYCETNCINLTYGLLIRWPNRLFLGVVYRYGILSQTGERDLADEW